MNVSPDILKKANEDYEASRVRFKLKRSKVRIEENQFESFKPIKKSIGEPPLKDVLFELQKGICALCKLPMKFNSATIDHIIPLSKGGSNKPENKQLAHGLCNSVKGNSLETLTPPQFCDAVNEFKSRQRANASRRKK